MAYKPSKSVLLSNWKKFNGKNSTLGRRLVSKGLCVVAPYFDTIKPIFTVVEPGHVEVLLRNRRGVRNHLNSVHAIAMCNAAELAGGSCLDVSLHGDYRWIPVGMTVKYQKMGKTDLRAVCKIDDWHWEEKRDVIMPVKLYDANNVVVFSADITMHISPKKRK